MSAVQVQRTNDNSSVSKASTTNAGYFDDRWISKFVVKTSKRSAIIHRGYYIRMLTIDYFLKTFLKEVGSEGQVLSLGAGFDSAFFRLKSSGLLKSRYTEVDFPEVILQKINLISANQNLSVLIDQKTCLTDLNSKRPILRSLDYVLIGLNLEQVSELPALLLDCGVDLKKPTLILSECVLTYIVDRHSSDVILCMARTFQNAAFISYEQVCPGDGFGRVMLDHFTSIGSPLKCVTTYPSPQSQEARYLKLGWEVSTAKDMNYFYYALQTEEQRIAIGNLEMFDEYEGWHMKCCHYVLVSSFKGSLTALVDCFKISKSTQANILPNSHIAASPVVPLAIRNNKENQHLIQRFGHTSAQLPQTNDCRSNGSGRVLLYGGFGLSEKAVSHGRLDSLILVQFKVADGELITIIHKCQTNGDKPGKLMHASLAVSNDGFVLFGGRQSPSNPSNGVFSLKRLRDEEYKWISLKTGGASPIPRWRHTADVIRERNVMVVIGGKAANGECLNDAHQLNLTTLKWTKCVASGGHGLTGCHSHRSAVWKDCIAVYGGLDKNDIPTNRLYMLTILDDHHLELNEVKCHPSLPARYSSSCLVHNDSLVIVGGVEWNLEMPEVILVDLLSHKASFVQLQLPKEPLLFCGTTCVLLDGENKDGSSLKVALFSGGANCFSFGTYFNKTPHLLQC